MATSGSIDWSLTAGDVITRAFRLIKRLGQSESVPGELSTTGLSVLNAMLKGWQDGGVLLSALTEGSITLTDGTASYALSPRALRVASVRYRNASSVDALMMELTRDSYFMLPNKAATGATAPYHYYVDRQLATTTMYVYPVLATAVGTVRFTYQRIIEDCDATTNDLDISQEHLETVVYGLARRLAHEFADLSSPSVQDVIGLAKDLEGRLALASRTAAEQIAVSASGA